MFKVNNKDTYFTPCSSVSIVNFEHAIAGWDMKISIDYNKASNQNQNLK